MRIHGKRPRFSEQEIQIQFKVAQQLGFEAPRELGQAMLSDKDLRKQVKGMMAELGFDRGARASGPEHLQALREARQQVAEEYGYDNPRELGQAMKGDPVLRKEVGEKMQELGFGPRRPGDGHCCKGQHGAGPGQEAPDQIGKLAIVSGFVDSSGKPDIAGFLQAVRSGEIKDPGIVSVVGPIVGIEPQDDIENAQSNKNILSLV